MSQYPKADAVIEVNTVPMASPPEKSETGVEVVDVNKHFDGARHWDWSKWRVYENPPLAALNASGPLPPSRKYRHRDILHRITSKPKDVLRYISPSDGKASRMFVQATRDAKATVPGDWRRCDVSGNAPLFLRLSTWCLGSKAKKNVHVTGGHPDYGEWGFIALRTLAAVPAFGILLLFGLGNAPPLFEFYKAFPSVAWEYPKHARNQLDAHPHRPVRAQDRDGASYAVIGEQQRLLTPRVLMVRERDGEWRPRPGDHQPYILISYAAKHYPLDPRTRISRELESIAQSLAQEHGVAAYWLDYRCRAAQQPELTDDIHRICDVIRGARHVCVVMPNLEASTLQGWGSRMWTLPEALLCQAPTLQFYTPTQTVEYSKMDLPGLAWPNDGEASRLLAEHFVGTVTLSRLELISVSLTALRAREWTVFQQGDLAYALMSLLRVRPRMDPTDSEYQALARLSLANDSDRIVERMACMLPPTISASHGWFAFEDILGAKLWDIEPLCQVAGVCHDGSLILDGCRGVSIRWKDIPQIAYARNFSWRRLLAKFLAHSGSIWLITGIVLVPGAPGVGVLILLVGILLLLAAPWTIKLLYGGKLWGQSPWFVGFEGTLPVERIEELTFGNCIGRLRMAPSSSNFCDRSADERIGLNPPPDRLRPEHLPPGHRLFTLIDTCTLTVSIFSAVRPPSVALMCGREGGMLRVLLCSYERSTNALQKQSVLRMESPIYEHARSLGWLKLG